MVVLVENSNLRGWPCRITQFNCYKIAVLVSLLCLIHRIDSNLHPTPLLENSNLNVYLTSTITIFHCLTYCNSYGVKKRCFEEGHFTT